MADERTGLHRPAGWKKDPTGRHFGRWWDGNQWTKNVISANKVQSIDPLAAWLEPLTLPEIPPPAPPRTAAATPPPPPPRREPGKVLMAAPSMETATGPSAPPPRREPGKVLMAAPSMETATGTAGGVLDSIRGSSRSVRWTLAVVTLLVVISAVTAGNADKKTGDVQVTPAPTATPVTAKPSRDSQLAAFTQSFESIRVVLADAITKENPVSIASVDRFDFDLEGPTVILSVTMAYGTAQYQRDGAWAVTKAMQPLWEARTIVNVPDVIPHFRLTLGTVRYECPHDFMMRLASLRASREDWEATCRLT